MQNVNTMQLSGGYLLSVVLVGLAVFLALILLLRIQAFIGLLITSIVVGLLAGMEPLQLVASIKSGMGNPGMGALIIVIGLGGMFGAILEHSGGASSIAGFLIDKMGVNNAPLALLLSGFIIAIPVFFDVAFIILIPLVYALQKQTGKSLLLYAIPLLSGLAITHTFIPPTPGPILVADMIGADLGWVILVGFCVGIPTALVSGLWFGKTIAKKIHVGIPEEHDNAMNTEKLPSFAMVAAIIGLPILFIVLSTFIKSELIDFGKANTIFLLLGEPFVALIAANLIAWYFLGIRRGMSKSFLLKISSKSLNTVGVIILVTGAGAVFKQVLTDTGAGVALAETMTAHKIPILLFAFASAALVRVLQGSATVAMVTAAGLVAPVCPTGLSDYQLAILVITIASGASVVSHVNDSGFWLVSQYLGLSEKQTFRSWTMMTTLFGGVGFLIAVVLWSLT